MKMTGWFPPHIKPVRVGEYIAITTKLAYVRRWWDGNRWSLPYWPADPESIKTIQRRDPASPGKQRCIYWRGLAADPDRRKRRST